MKDGKTMPWHLAALEGIVEGAIDVSAPSNCSRQADVPVVQVEFPH
jgi:hypothetical protein